MKRMRFVLFLAVGSLPFLTSAASISTSADGPSNFLEDAFSEKGSTKFYGIDLLHRTTGQSFKHTTNDGAPWYLSSITLLSAKGDAQMPSAGFSINIYKGNSTRAVDLLGTFTFDSGTFDSTAGRYITFSLADIESGTVGELESGATYTITLTTTETNLKFKRSRIDAYPNGQGIWNNKFQSNTDAAFWITAMEKAPVMPAPVLLG